MSDRDVIGMDPLAVSRRDFLKYSSAAGAVVGSNGLLPSLTTTVKDPTAAMIRGGEGPVDLTIGESPVTFDGRTGTAVTINGTMPGPLLRFREGDDAVLRVTNTLDEDTSVHWHGILLPNHMDGVPGVNFEGISPGETF
jgi:FtsP/CotA-like multicopper oxidase with cupredoxin domain